MRVPHGPLPHAPEPPIASGKMRIERFLDARPLGKVGKANYAATDSVAILAARNIRNLSRFANRRKVRGRTLVILPAAFDEDRRPDIVARMIDFIAKVRDPVGIARPHPEMMVRIDDRDFRFDGGFNSRVHPGSKIGGPPMDQFP